MAPNVKLISITRPVDSDMTPEQLIVYTARVSSPPNQYNLDTSERLLRYCIKNKHWSIFSMVDMTVEIDETSRAISAQIIRHQSFDFQEFSQRYSEVAGVEFYNARRQDLKNRQHSVDDLPDSTKQWFQDAQDEICQLAGDLYNEALEKGIAKECARFLLPMSSTTRLYMKGSVRSWIHYLEVRTHSSVQKEHRDIALLIKEIFNQNFPLIAKAMQITE